MMKLSNSDNIKFYHILGKLFYAIAASDKTVKDAEFVTLKDLVKSDWLAIDENEDDFSTDTAFQIEFVFDWLNSQEHHDPKRLFDEFVAYKKAHSGVFTNHINKLIMKTAGNIAASFSGVNKSELMLLANLDMELKRTL